MNEDVLEIPQAPGLVFTDLGNARRFAETHENRVRYCHDWQKWLVWDNRRWAVDRTGRVVRLAKNVAEQMWHEGLNEHNPDKLKHATRSASADKISAMLKMAQSENGIPVEPKHLDVNPWLLNCTNGTVDLRTGVLAAHSRDHLLTKLCPTAYKPDAQAPVWGVFINSVFAGSEKLIQFVQRLLGYALTGDVREQILAIFHGVGANGKSTLLNCVMDVMGGDYSIKAKSGLLVAKRQQEHSTEQMDLFGVRLAVCSETDDGQRFDEGLVKDLTGCDKIRGRRMREDTWEYTPSHKLVLATNHRPAVRGTDHAIWRRLRLVPFTQVFDGDKQDRQLPEKLRAEAEGILAWLVQGCLAWQQHGLGMPDEVETATAEYRTESDVLGAFLSECCLTAQTCCVRASNLYAAYRRWCDQTGEHDVGQRRFGQAMTERGVERLRNNGYWYRGVGLKADMEQTDGTE